MEDGAKWFPPELREKYDFFNYNHAAEILSQSFSTEFKEIIQALSQFEITIDEIRMKGGNESPIPPKFNSMLDPLGWREIRISGDLLIKIYPRKGEKKANSQMLNRIPKRSSTILMDTISISLKTGSPLMSNGTVKIRRSTEICLLCVHITSATSSVWE